MGGDKSRDSKEGPKTPTNADGQKKPPTPNQAAGRPEENKSGSQAQMPAGQQMQGSQVQDQAAPHAGGDGDAGGRRQAPAAQGVFQSIPLREYYDQNLTVVLLEGLKELGKQR